MQPWLSVSVNTRYKTATFHQWLQYTILRGCNHACIINYVANMWLQSCMRN